MRICPLFFSKTKMRVVSDTGAVTYNGALKPLAIRSSESASPGCEKLKETKNMAHVSNRLLEVCMRTN